MTTARGSAAAAAQSLQLSLALPLCRRAHLVIRLEAAFGFDRSFHQASERRARVVRCTLELRMVLAREEERMRVLNTSIV